MCISAASMLRTYSIIKPDRKIVAEIVSVYTTPTVIFVHTANAAFSCKYFQMTGFSWNKYIPNVSDESFETAVPFNRSLEKSTTIIKPLANIVGDS